MDIAQTTDALAALGDSICPHAGRLFRWALGVAPSSVVRAELRATALARLEESLRAALLCGGADVRLAALGGLVALAHPRACGPVKAAKSIAWAAGRMTRDFQRAPGAPGEPLSIWAPMCLIWLPPRAIWVGPGLTPSFVVPVSGAFDLRQLDPSGDAPLPHLFVFGPGFKSDHPDIDQALAEPLQVRALPEVAELEGFAARHELSRSAWNACQLARKPRVEWLVESIAVDVDELRSKAAVYDSPALPSTARSSPRDTPPQDDVGQLISIVRKRNAAGSTVTSEDARALRPDDHEGHKHLVTEANKRLASTGETMLHSRGSRASRFPPVRAVDGEGYYITSNVAQ